MRNAEAWRPSKFEVRGGHLTVSQDVHELAVTSRLSAAMVLRFWDVALGRYARGRLLDLGCGKVPLYQAYRSYVEEVTCVDWAQSAHGTRFSDVLCDLSEPLPFGDDEFDVALMSSVLEHVARPEVAWREVARVLKPGGHFLLNVPFFYWVHEAPHDYYRYTEFALRRFCDTYGLSVIMLEATGGAPEILLDIGSKVAAGLPLVGRTLSASMQWFGLRAVAHRSVAAFSRRTAKTLPLGYFLVAQKPQRDFGDAASAAASAGR